MTTKGTALHSTGFMTLDQVLNDSCDKARDFQKQTYAERLIHAVYALRDLAKTVPMQTNFRRCFLEVDRATNRVYYPDDYVKYVKLGFIHGGNFIRLGHNENMAPPQENCGMPQPVQGGDARGFPWYVDDFEPSDTWPGWVWGGSFGQGGGYSMDGYFKEDHQARAFMLSWDVRHDHLALEYITDGYDPTGINYVHVHCVDAVHKYIAMGLFETEATANHDQFWQNKYEGKRREYHFARAEAKKALSGSNIAEMVAAHRRSAGGAPRV